MRQTRSAPPRDLWIRHLETIASQDRADHRRLHVAAIAALVAHTLLFTLRLPETQRVLAVTPTVIRFPLTAFTPRPRQPLPPRPHKPEPPPPEVTRATIIVPGPPEVDIAVAEPLATPPVQALLAALEPLDIIVPTAPPPPIPALPARWDSSIQRPQRLFTPLPAYTQTARRARLQGRVILEAIIDETGAVVDLKVLKGLGLGLDESALDTVGTWRFEPARRKGRAIAVIYNLVINFRLH